jgi:hypothetical protein
VEEEVGQVAYRGRSRTSSALTKVLVIYYIKYQAALKNNIIRKARKYLKSINYIYILSKASI